MTQFEKKIGATINTSKKKISRSQRKVLNIYGTFDIVETGEFLKHVFLGNVDLFTPTDAIFKDTKNKNITTVFILMA